jgi:predicted transcriptional regulator
VTENKAPEISRSELLHMASDIAAAYVSNNSVPADQLPEVIRAVHASLAAVHQGTDTPQTEMKPAVPVRRSVTPDYIICLEDGKKLKMLKRHLRSAYDMSPDQYRAKWGLPSDYPMVAPNYAAQRSQFAKKIGLGRTSGAKNGRGG